MTINTQTKMTTDQMWAIFRVVDALPVALRVGVTHQADIARGLVTLRIASAATGTAALRDITSPLTADTASACIRDMRAELARRVRRTTHVRAAERELDRE